jgi:hypothetical protein
MILSLLIFGTNLHQESYIELKLMGNIMRVMSYAI